MTITEEEMKIPLIFESVDAYLSYKEAFPDDPRIADDQPVEIMVDTARKSR